MTEKYNICVYGAVNNKIDKNYIDKGIELGKRIAKENMGVVFSGMKSGISGAVAEGASNIENADIIAVMPEFFKETKQDEIFQKCTKIIYEKDIQTRKETFKRLADAIIVLPGGVGTFDELFDAICTKRWGIIDVPIVIYNINNYYANLIDMLEYSIKTNFGKENYRETYKIFDDMNDIFEYIKNY